MRVKWLQQALLDLREVEAYIYQDNPTAAAEVALKIIEAVSLLREQQGIGRTGRVPGTRELVVSGLPYIVPYRVIGETVQILRVYHTSRKWPSRL
ncbi:type II toxin-antitoxin system RelE/ParE family toxin [Desulfurivibrio alkaliphilus]|uniref:Addiction module toxin, RelE/StbE family n=1 Tax=Desulfurivibrio alkaliphilus (strain DSM 19089 / UNIQEM U267 / AHT2) TaxID=589865 RepID=D6Z4N0_DESAT|nr:addiction module toxin, RelE/StbE family [Desulfurivibrio alkaliphilus AHT 2]